MSEELSSRDFHLSHDPVEDRMLVAVDVAPGQVYAMAMTRRLVKQLISALADQLAVKRGAAIGGDQQRRDTVLNFEHAEAVAQGFSTGHARVHHQSKSFIAAPRLVREVIITPREDGSMTTVLDDKERRLTIELDAQRLHTVMAGMLELAAQGGWDLPVIAAWLERAGAADASLPKVVH